MLSGGEALVSVDGQEVSRVANHSGRPAKVMAALWGLLMPTMQRSMVVLPTPGRPRINRLLPSSTRSWMMSRVPYTARPTRQVSPTMSPRRLRIAEMRCRVRSRPPR